MTLEALVFLIIQHLIGLLSIGPCTALVIRNSLYDRNYGMRTVLGATLGSFSIKTLSILGLAAILSHYPNLFNIFKTVGGAYLIFLGGSSLYRAKKEFDDRFSVMKNNDVTQISGSPFLAGYLMSMANPMSSVRFIALFSTIITVHTTLLVQLSCLIILAIISLLFYSIMALFFSTAKIQIMMINYKYILSFILGISLIYWGLKIL